MGKYFFLLVVCFTGNFLFAPAKTSIPAETNFNPIKKIAKEIAKSNVYEISTTTAYRGTPSQQTTRYKQLLQIASVDDLTELATKNKNAVVRLYAFNGLVNKLKEVPKEIVDQFRNDTTTIKVLKGDITNDVPLNKIASGLLY
jgi:GTP-sensing pleiotropic transcriptional regulator CodY